MAEFRAARESNASIHRGQLRLLTLDVKSFFDTVQHRRVYRMFRDEYGYGHDVSRLLTRLTTIKGVTAARRANKSSHRKSLHAQGGR